MTTNIRYVPFWEDDFEADTLGMKPEHKWIYWKLCVAITRSDTGWIKDDDNWISARVGISAARWRRTRPLLDHFLTTRTDKESGNQLSQYRARREHGVATVKLRGNQKGGKTKAKNDSKKKRNGKGKPNENNGTPSSQPDGQPHGQLYGQPGGQPYGQPSSNRTEQKVISIEEITSERASADLTTWVMKHTRLEEKPVAINPSLVKTWERLYHPDDIRKAVEQVVKQRSYNPDEIKGLAYFSEAIIKLDSKRKKNTKAKIDSAVRGLSVDDFSFLVERWLDDGQWPCDVYGPDPSMKGNHLPKGIRAKFAGAIATKKQANTIGANGADGGVDFDSA